MTASEVNGGGQRLPPIGNRSWYDVLDVARDASGDDIEVAYDRAIALIDGQSIGGYMVLDPESKASARNDVETAFLVLSDPQMRAAFDEATAADEPSPMGRLDPADLLGDDEEWIASEPPRPADPAVAEEGPTAEITSIHAASAAPSTLSSGVASPSRSGAASAQASSIASLHRADTGATSHAGVRKQAAPSAHPLDGMGGASDAKPEGAESTPPTGSSLRFLAPVFDDTSGPVRRADTAAEKTEELPTERVEPSAVEPSAVEPSAVEPSVVQPRDVQPEASKAREEATPRPRPFDPPKAPRPRLVREARLAPDEAPTAPPTVQPVVSQIKTLPPELEELLVEGSEVNGQVIKRLRESRKLTLDEVASATHIRKAYLVAIEDMDIDELPARVYLRGFLTQIARVLKVDKKRLSEGYLTFAARFQR